MPTSIKKFIPGKIADELGIQIVSGKLKPGATLVGEIVASGQRRVSRSAYREAIRILIAKGLVESRPKSGTQVSPQTAWHLLDPHVLSWMFAKEPQRALLASLYELRRVIEPPAAALAAEHRTLTQLNEMGRALEAMARETLHTDEGRCADETFHLTLLASCGNPFLASLGGSVTAAVRWSTLYKHRASGLTRDSMPEHMKVYEAIAGRDTNAARAHMADLINLAFADVTEILPAP